LALRNGLQLVLQYPEGFQPTLRCVGFTGLQRTSPVLVVVLAGNPANQGAARRLGQSLERAVNNLPGARPSSTMPCGGQAGHGCHALDEPTCKQVVVLVGDATSRVQVPPWLSLAPHVQFVPVLPKGTNVAAAVPPSMSRINTSSFEHDVTDAVPDILAAAGLSTGDQRIFISYRRRETQALAEQLFDSLSHEGFDVFLDRFRIPPAADFQARLEQELADKGMLLVLESRGISASNWVMREIAFARARRMGIIGLRLPDGDEVPQIRKSCRVTIFQRELKGKSRAVRLQSICLRRVVASVRMLHARALVHRQLVLPRAMSRALSHSQCRNVTIGAGGIVSAQPQSLLSRTEYQISLTARSPDLSDFHVAATNRAAARGVVVGPCASFEQARRVRFDWLQGISQVIYRDELDILDLAREIAAERV
jgi:TIR domain